MQNISFASNEAHTTVDTATGLTHADPQHQPARDDASALPPSQAAPLQAAQEIIGDICQIAACDDLWPEIQVIGAQALLDELARALARMALDQQPEGFPHPSEPDR